MMLGLLAFSYAKIYQEINKSNTKIVKIFNIFNIFLKQFLINEKCVKFNWINCYKYFLRKLGFFKQEYY